MSDKSTQSQATPSASPLVTVSYAAKLVCTDRPSVVADQESGIFSRFVQLVVDHDLTLESVNGAWTGRDGLPLDMSQYQASCLSAKREPVNAQGHDNYSLTVNPELGSEIPGFTGSFVCDQQSKAWKRPLDERHPSTLDGTLNITATKQARDDYQEMCLLQQSRGSHEIMAAKRRKINEEAWRREQMEAKGSAEVTAAGEQQIEEVQLDEGPGPAGWWGADA